MKLKSLAPAAPDPDLLQQLEAGALANHDCVTAEVEAFRSELEQQGGLPIRVRHDVAGIGAAGTLRSAWTTANPQPHHAIELGPMPPFLAIHALAHELVHLEMQIDNVMAGRLARPYANAGQMLVCSGVKPDRYALIRYGSEIRDVCACILDLPQDLIVETRLAERFPLLAPAQRHLAHQHEYDRAKSVVTANDSATGALPAMRRGYTALSAAAALGWDRLLGDTHFADGYRPLSEWKIAGQIFGLFERFKAGRKPGDEYQLIDAVAAVMRFPKLFRWEPVPASLGFPSPVTPGQPDIL